VRGVAGVLPWQAERRRAIPKSKTPAHGRTHTRERVPVGRPPNAYALNRLLGALWVGVLACVATSNRFPRIRSGAFRAWGKRRDGLDRQLVSTVSATVGASRDVAAYRSWVGHPFLLISLNRLLRPRSVTRAVRNGRYRSVDGRRGRDDRCSVAQRHVELQIGVSRLPLLAIPVLATSYWNLQSGRRPTVQVVALRACGAKRALEP
jgi:hypothetical protein